MESVLEVFQTKKNYIKHFIDSFNKQVSEKTKTKKSTSEQKKLKQLEERKAHLKTEFALGNITIKEYRDFVGVIQNKITTIQTKLNSINEFSKKIDSLRDKLPKIIEKLSEIYRKVENSKKRKIINVLFPSGIYYNIETCKIETQFINPAILKLIDNEVVANYFLEKIVKNSLQGKGWVEQGTQMESFQADIINLTRLTKIMQSA